MAAADDDFNFLLVATSRLLGEIRREIEARQQENARGTVLAGHVLNALTAIETKVEEERSRYASRQSRASKAAGSRALRFYAQLVWATHSALRWLGSNEERQLDLGSLYFADEIALTLVGEGVEVNPVASGEYMYSTSSWPFDWLSEKLGEPEGEPPIPVVLTYPAHESLAVLLHCLFAHELGHPAVREKDLVAKALEPLRSTGEFDDLLSDAAKRAKQLGPLVEARAPVLAELWIEELLCDALAFAALGPSYLFAFAEMGLSVGWSEPDEEHPSMALRSKLLVNFCEQSGWSEVVDERFPTIWEWLKYAASAPSKLQNPGETFADWICRKALGQVIDLARETLGNDQFTPADWTPNSERLLELLENDILPAEVDGGTAATHPEIMLACWFSALDSQGDQPSSIAAAVAERDYQRFVSKALEMSTILRVWPQACLAAAEEGESA